MGIDWGRLLLNKIGSYEVELVNISPKKWDAFLKEHSHLPGPKANLELAKAFSRVGTLMDFKKYIRLDEEDAPENTPDEFLTFCGVIGFGQYLAEYHDGGLLMQLMERANDPRWRIREAVVLALQIIGKKRLSRLMGYLSSWVEGTYLEQRAAIKAICEPDLLTDPKAALLALELLEWATATMVECDDLQDEEYYILKEALSDCWSVAVVALPEKGKSMMDRWIKEKHPVVSLIMKENLQKERLSQLDQDWVKTCLKKVS